MSIRRSSLICVAYLQVYERVSDLIVEMCVGMVMRPEMSPPFSIQKVEIVLRDV